MVERRIRERRIVWGRRTPDAFATRERPRLLLIEPHDDTRLLYADLFEAAGYAVEGVADGPTGIARAQRRLPDVIIMEMAVPRADGFAILAQLQQDDATSTIP